MGASNNKLPGFRVCMNMVYHQTCSVYDVAHKEIIPRLSEVYDFVGIRITLGTRVIAQRESAT